MSRTRLEDIPELSCALNPPGNQKHAEHERE
jgi:hypothetical protein